MSWTAEKIKKDSDWRQALDFAPFAIEDIVDVIAARAGAPDDYNWLGVFKLKGRKYGFVNAGCDFTGWDCRSSGNGLVEGRLKVLIEKIPLEDKLDLGLGKGQTPVNE